MGSITGNAETLRLHVQAGDHRALELLPDIFRQLTPKEEKVVRLVWGIGCERKHSATELAKEFDVLTKRITSILRQGLTRLESIGVDKTLLDATAALCEKFRQRPALLRSSIDQSILEVRNGVERLIDEGKVSKEQLLALSPRQFEELVAEIWSRFGYTVELTARTRDGGKDVVAVKNAEAEVRYIIECKRYDNAHKVGVSLVRALYGVKMHEGATKAFLATTSTFTQGAIQLFEDHKWELEPKDYDGVLQWAKQAKTGIWVRSPSA